MRDQLTSFLHRHADIVRVRIESARGSAPRGAGTEMFVTPDALCGTIGGGQLEYMAIDTARAMLRTGRATDYMNVPLGPEIGQCCGGRVRIALDRLTEATRADTLRASAREQATRPAVFIFGAGHVGRALAGFLAQLPVRAILIDSRAEELALCKAPVDRRHCVLPEAEIRVAPAGSAFIILTHDHALDFLLTAEALARTDAAYVGMIGSATKRAKFAGFCKSQSPQADIRNLVCPIGATGSTDKRPELIAAFVAAEVMAALTTVTTRYNQSAM